MIAGNILIDLAASQLRNQSTSLLFSTVYHHLPYPKCDHSLSFHYDDDDDDDDDLDGRVDHDEVCSCRHLESAISRHRPLLYSSLLICYLVPIPIVIL